MRCDTGYNKNHTIATYLGVLLHHTKHRIGQRMYKRMVVEHLPRITERIVLELRNPRPAIHRPPSHLISKAWASYSFILDREGRTCQSRRW